MATWFSASAVVPALTAAWGLNDSGRAWLTISVQIGFVCGAFASALLNLADRIAAPKLFVISALLSALATGLIPLLGIGLTPALLLRFLSGVFLAGVYPVGMKIVATWTQRYRGLGIGLLVGAVNAGLGLSASAQCPGWCQRLGAGSLPGSSSGGSGRTDRRHFVRQGPTHRRRRASTGTTSPRLPASA